MQHDVFVNPHLATRARFPFIAVLQADIAEARERIVAPMALASDMDLAVARTMPLVDLRGNTFRLLVPLMVLVPEPRLKNAVGSIRQHRDDITRAIDWLFTGV